MANAENLKTPTPEQARERGRKGGIASGKARREKKAFKEAFNELLADTHTYKDQTGQGTDLIAAAIFKQALEGDIKSATFIRDITEGKPHTKLDEYDIDKKEYEKEQREKDRNLSSYFDIKFP